MLDELKSSFLAPLDYSYVDYLKETYSNKINYIFMLLLIVVIYLYYNLSHFLILSNEKKASFGIILFIIFPFIILVLTTTPYQIVFSEKPKMNDSKFYDSLNSHDKIFYQIKNKEPIRNLYQLMVKYNFPCFPNKID